jgi:hypothetical protein
VFKRALEQGLVFESKGASDGRKIAYSTTKPGDMA